MIKCKLCSGTCKEEFRTAKDRLTGQKPEQYSDDLSAIYVRCTRCNFVFSSIIDNDVQEDIYDGNYWENQDPDFYGRSYESFRLLTMASSLIETFPQKAIICDFGSGPGGFVQTASNLGYNIIGTDIIKPMESIVDKFLPAHMFEKQTEKYDIITACEVIEHLPNPMESIGNIMKALRPGGCFAFQTAVCPETNVKDWWYVGPANGHVSLYSEKAFSFLRQRFQIMEYDTWNSYAGVQVWKKD